MLMVLSAEIYILKYFRVYKLNNDSDKPAMNIPLKYNSVTEWVATLLPITSHRKSEMVIAGG